MTDASLPAGRFTQANFRVGDVFSRAWSVFSRNFFKFGLATGAASLPTLLAPQPGIGPAGNLNFNMPLFFTAVGLVMVLNLLSQAIVFYGAFQDMRQRPVSLIEGFKVSLGRFFPLVGLGIVFFLAMFVIAMFAGILFVVPGLKYLSPLIVIPIGMLGLMWSMGTPVCVVERAGPLHSLGRSRELTKGCRWKIFGLLLLIVIPGLIVSAIVGAALGTIHALGPTSSLATAATQVLGLIWNALWTAFFAVVIVVTYHNLRVAKEGIDTDQIAAVFE
jgi:hypothetical protein